MESPSHLERDRPTNQRARSGALDQWEAEAGAHTSVPPVDTGRAPHSDTVTIYRLRPQSSQNKEPQQNIPRR